MMKQRLMGVLAWLVLAGIVVGLPALLIALGGSPIPTNLPTVDGLRQALTTPDDGTLVLAAVKVLGWLVWAALAATILVELIAQVRGLPAPSVPALGVPQATARGLVTAALALFIATPTLAAPAFAGGPAQALPAVTAPAAVAQNGDEPQQTADQVAADQTPTEQQVVPYTVQTGDTLWSIADKHLGSGQDFNRIVELNRTVLTDGADWLAPGMRLHLPEGSTAAAGEVDEQGQYVVAEGDTLSEIAAEHLGDANRWPDIFEASAGIEQPDGQHLTDPDLILPGWRLTIPGMPAATPPAPDPIREDPAPAPVEDPPEDSVEELSQIAQDAGQQGAGVGVMSAAMAGEQTPAPAEDGGEGQMVSDTVTEEQEDAELGWMLPGLIGSGALLSGGMLVVLSARRRGQFRNRRPGRTITTPEPAVAPVEMTVQTIGREAAVTLQDLDDILRRLGGLCAREGTPVPVLAAVQLTQADLRLHLAEPADLAAPWVGTEDHLQWTLTVDTPREEVGPLVPGHRAPYPLLASIGSDDAGGRWLLNLEDLQTAISGADEYVLDLARYLAADIAVNPWATGVRLDCIGVAEEVAAMNPARVRAATTEVLADTVAGVVGVIDRLEEGTDVPTARAAQAADDTWPARMVMVTAEAAAASAHYDQLTELLESHEGRTAAAVVVIGDHQSTHAARLIANEQGRVLLPDFGLDLVGVGLTGEEAKGCAALLAQGEDVLDAPMPVREVVDHASQGWRSWSDEAGALRPEHTVPRAPRTETTDTEEPAPAHTLLPEPDEDYLDAAATTAADIDTLAPHVPPTVSQQVVDTDPRLDADLEAWWAKDSALPRLTLMGPVGARTRGKPLVDRRPYFTELLAYLALRPNGATVEETADAFGLNAGKIREYARRCREWLGTNPRTDEPHLPHASRAPAAKNRGVNVYQVIDVLVDLDLFRRLRVRGEARGGPEGIADLRQALRLVQGRPFSQLRTGGWGWLFEGDRLDHHIVCAIVDVAHLVAVHDLQAGETTSARQAAEVAALAAPDEEIPTLDLAAVAHAEGHFAEAVKLLRGEVCNRVEDEDSVPGELPERTQEILDRRGWLNQREAG
ncbi:LysM peptidoglycan-binding domain-containing protein [Ornithinimicrobium murale]|uniref:LysM peptidoglycan-binding domain-containing protein n=1 Tax=Ornithinimicrobium murale TaxID=1050153 RepID=UPI0013B358D9|nr:LysM peptidoglycan-binding domain-containing protein [Ornithinimicrobium murale]